MGATDIDEDAAETLVMSRKALPNAAKPDPPPESGIVTSSKPPESVVIEQPKPKAPDPAPSLWQRFANTVDRCVASFSEVFFGALPPLSEALPNVPSFRPRQGTIISADAVADDEQGERMLMALLRASPKYQIAAIAVARRALVMRDDGPDAYLDFLVHFAISRIPPNKNGQIGVERLRDMLPHKIYSRDILPALVRLKERGLVVLVLGDNRGDPMVDIQHENLKCIELRQPV